MIQIPMFTLRSKSMQIRVTARTPNTRRTVRVKAAFLTNTKRLRLLLYPGKS